MRAKRLFQTCFVRCSQIGLVMVTAWLLYGCNYPSFKEDRPTCLPEEITVPARLVTPSDGETIATLAPRFIWDWGADCDPDEFLVELLNPIAPPAIASERVAGHSRGLDTFRGLQPNSAYIWQVTPYVGGRAGTTSPVNTFFTGPDCSGPGIDYPALVLVAPPDGTEITEMTPIHVSDGSVWPSVSIQMIWDDPSLCNPDGYQIQVSTSPAFSAGQTQDRERWDPATFDQFFFAPDDASFPFQDCTLYYWHVRAIRSPGAYGSWSETWTFFVHTNGLVCETIPVITPVIPLPVPDLNGAPPALTLSAPITASGLQNTNCRIGPSRVFSIVSTLYEDQSVRVVGRTEDSSWWLIDHPDLADACWVWTGSVDISGDVTLVPVLAGPATPVIPISPQPEQGDKPEEDEPGQDVTPGCWIIDNLHPNGYCVPRVCGPNDYPGNDCNP